MGERAVKTEQATVYRAGRRRYLTKRHAYLAAARKRVNEKCECEREYMDTPGYTCPLHESPDHYTAPPAERITERLARWLQWRDERGGRDG